MFNKIIYISMWLVLVAFTTTSIAGGESTHVHKHGADESVSKPMQMPSEEHSGHQHDSEGSAVGKPAACNVPGHFEAGMFQTVDIK